MTTYPYTLIAIIPTNEKLAVEQAVIDGVTLFEGDNFAFPVPLSNNQPTVTHWGACAVISEAQRLELFPILSGYTVTYWLCLNPEFTFIRGNDGGMAGQFLDFDMAIGLIGLERVQPEGFPNV